jgi:hypothetical protein
MEKGLAAIVTLLILQPHGLKRRRHLETIDGVRLPMGLFFMCH